jgi:hypothetical protein
MGSHAGISQQHIFLHKRVEFKLQGPYTTIFNAWNMNKSFKKKLKLWIADGNSEMFQSYSD